MNIRKIIREEINDWDWVREIPLDIPFSNLKIGEPYRIETTKIFREALEACNKSERLLYAYMVIPAIKSKDRYNDVFCDHERQDFVDTIYLEFYDENHRDLGSFWVSEDMVKFYFLKSDIKENEEDDWGWIDKSEYNPWDKYEYIEIDVEPKQENLELLVNLALTKDYITGKSKEQWSRNMTSNIEDIMDYFDNEGRAYIRMEDGDLWYGHTLGPYSLKWTKYSEIFGKNINESEEDDFGWIESEENPWSDIPEETINQLTEEEKKLILYIMDSETYWNKRQGCEPKYKIDDIEFDEYDNWFGGFNHGLKRKIKLCFTTTCENQTYNNKTYLCATIDRNTLDYHVA